MTTYARPPLALVRGEGSRGLRRRRHTTTSTSSPASRCACSATPTRGLEAVTGQLSTLGHTSNLYATEPAVGLAEKLLGLLGPRRRRRHALLLQLRRRGQRGRHQDRPAHRAAEIIAAEGSFHGRTMGALSITGQPAKRAPFEPLLPGVRFVPYGDAEALRAAVSTQTAAVFLEPTLGEGGVVPPPAGYLQAAREICDAAGALLVLDEVQSVGRTGTWYAHQQAGIVPDVITLAKGLAGGLPIGACIGLGRRGGPAAAGRPRQHVRRQSGRLRRSARRHRRHRVRGPHRPGRRGGRAAGRRAVGLRRAAADRRARQRPVARDDAGRAGGRRCRARRFATPASWSIPSRPTPCGWRRRWCSPRPRPSGSSPPCQACWQIAELGSRMTSPGSLASRAGRRRSSSSRTTRACAGCSTPCCLRGLSRRDGQRRASPGCTKPLPAGRRDPARPGDARPRRAAGAGGIAANPALAECRCSS